MNLRSLPMLSLAASACLTAQLGCAPSQAPGSGQQAGATRRALSPENAAVLAAKLANEECQRRYRRQPFQPSQYTAFLRDGIYHWGQLDVGGEGGFSSLVTFRPDGSQPHVEVYFSSDSLIAPKLR